MPVTRSSSRQASHQPSTQPYVSRRADPSGSGGSKKPPNLPSNEIIVLSSDDDEHPPKGTSSKKSSGRKGRRKAAAPLHSDEVLEISSDDGPKPKKSSKSKEVRLTRVTTEDLQRANEKLKEELERTEQLLAWRSGEVEELKRNCVTKDVLSNMEDQTSCEVCSLTMWCPYILPECGHSFCERCLQDWFNATQAQHMTANPQLDGDRVALAKQLHALVQMVPSIHAYGPHGRHHVCTLLAELRRHQPEYTCPSCRKGVLTKPVENFRLKSLVNQIAEMMGEMNPRKDVPRNQGDGPFDHFFAGPISVR